MVDKLRRVYSMKKIISAVLAVMCVMSVFSACGSEAAPNTEVTVSESVSEEEQSSDSVIRNIKWGMSIGEVKSSETAEFDSEKENKSLRYKNIDMFGQKFDLTYAFDVSDGLYSAVYGSPDLMPDDAAALQKSIIDTLTEKYGKGEDGSPLYDLIWYSGDTKISLFIGTPKDNDTLTYFRIWYQKDDDAASRSDNGNL